MTEQLIDPVCLKIRVRAAAECGKAKAAVVKLLAEIPGLHRRAINITSGTTATRKIVEIDSLTGKQVHTRLETRNHSQASEQTC